MAKPSNVKGFPEISNKLGAPTKKSLFERQKAEAEAKRHREQQETAAVYEDFVKSFDDDGENVRAPSASIRGGPGGSGFSKRHFSGPGSRGGLGSQRNSGPGSLGPPPPSLSRRRPVETPGPSRREGLFAFEDDHAGPADPKTALRHSDEEDARDQEKPEERQVPKPTIRLSSLPPGISPPAIKAILPSGLSVEAVRILPPRAAGTNGNDRRSATAVVTLAQDTPALDIDTAVNSLQNRYMGRGYYLSLSRHLSSTAVASEPPRLGLSSAISSLPFGARPIPNSGLGRAAPSSVHRGGFAPPTTFTPQSQFGRSAPRVQVTVTPPSELNQLKMIHKTVEALLKYGPEFEALLMTRREVQMDKKWAWLWDSRSVGGVYYRWRIWEVFSGAHRRRRGVPGSAPQYLFENGASWVGPEQKLPFEYTTSIEEVVSDSDYHSSEDEDSGDEARRRYAQHHGGAPPPDGPADDVETHSYLNPLQKAKLTHLLARLPDSNARLRRGDVARITAFSIQHAGEGSEEVVQMIVANIKTPFSCSQANPDYQPPSSKNEETVPDGTPVQDRPEAEDTSTAKLVALYILSDILSSSSTSGVRHAWRYRSMFENALHKEQTFLHLGRLEKQLKWGRLRAEKWKRSVNTILALWEGWCVFPQESQERFKNEFNEPPSTKEEEEKAAEEEQKKAEQAKKKWKSVEEREAEKLAENAAKDEDTDEDEAMEIEGVDGVPIPSDIDLDGEDLVYDDKVVARRGLLWRKIEGKPFNDSDSDEEPAQANQAPRNSDPEPGSSTADKRAALAASIAAKLGKTNITHHQASAAPPDADAPAGMVRKRQRPKAEDMFASDEE